jgi:hypothetical protein
MHGGHSRLPQRRLVDVAGRQNRSESEGSSGHQSFDAELLSPFPMSSVCAGTVELQVQGDSFTAELLLTGNFLRCNGTGLDDAPAGRHLMSALKSKATPGDTLRARPYSYRRLDPKDGSRW